jgi:hypothetical protein
VVDGVFYGIWNSAISSGDAHIFRRLTLRPNYINFWQDRTSNHMICHKANVFVPQSAENFVKFAFWIFSMSGYNLSITPICKFTLNPNGCLDFAATLQFALKCHWYPPSIIITRINPVPITAWWPGQPCLSRESNPGLQHGRWWEFHYTTPRARWESHNCRISDQVIHRLNFAQFTFNAQISHINERIWTDPFEKKTENISLTPWFQLKSWQCLWAINTI